MHQLFSITRSSARFLLPTFLAVALASPRAWSQYVPEEQLQKVRALEGVPEGSPPQVTLLLPPEAIALLDDLDRRRAAMEQEFAKAQQVAAEQLTAMAAAAQARGATEQAQALHDAIQKIQPATSPLPDPGNLMQFRGQIGRTYLFHTKGASTGTIWGAGIYTDDSPLAVAAVHAGVLKDGQDGVVRVTIQPGLPAYEGNLQNNLQSNPYGPFPGSYTVGPCDGNNGAMEPRTTFGPPLPGDPRPAPILSPAYPGAPTAPTQPGPAPVPTPALPGSPAAPTGPERPQASDHAPGVPEGDGNDRLRPNISIGASYTTEIIGATAGTVWGDGVYTSDSSLSTAAVHCGAVRVGEKASLTVTVLPGQDHYEGVSRNGVLSQPWQSWQSSFVIQKLAPAADANPAEKPIDRLEKEQLRLYWYDRPTR